MSGRIPYEKYASGFHIPELIERAHRVAQADNDHESQVDTIPTYEYYDSPIQIEGVDYTAHIRVRNTIMGDKYYGHTISEVEDIKIEPSARASARGKPRTPQSVYAIDGSINSIPQTTEGVNAQNVSDEQETPPDGEILTFVREQGERGKRYSRLERRVELGVVTQELGQTLAELTETDATGFTGTLSGGALETIQKHEDVSAEDVARLGEVLRGPDSVERVTDEQGVGVVTAEYEGSEKLAGPLVRFQKRIGDAVYTVDAIVEWNDRQLRVVDMRVEREAGDRSEDVDHLQATGYNVEKSDEEQWENIRERLGENAPKSFEEFQRIKRGGEWGIFEAYVKAVESGELTALADFDLYWRKSAEIDKLLVGLVTPNGLTVSGKSLHYIARTIGSVVQRRSGVDVAVALQTLLHPIEIAPIVVGEHGRSQRFIGENCAVTINPDTGMLIQINPLKGKKTKEETKGQ